MIVTDFAFPIQAMKGKLTPDGKYYYRQDVRTGKTILCIRRSERKTPVTKKEAEWHNTFASNLKEAKRQYDDPILKAEWQEEFDRYVAETGSTTNLWNYIVRAVSKTNYVFGFKDEQH